MTEEKGLVTADIDIFYSIDGFEGHTVVHLPGTPTKDTYAALVARLKEVGAGPRGAMLPGNAAPPPVAEEETPTCTECGGAMSYREGKSRATGKPYKGWFCSKRACKGEPIWLSDYE